MSELSGSFVIGIDHHHASVEVREKLSDMTCDQITLDVPELVESFVLSTCNRFEIYGAVKDPLLANKAMTSLGNVLQKNAGFSSEHSCKLLYYRKGEDMIRHGFSVASSLESMVLGEPQILGQMKQAYLLAKDKGEVSGLLERFCHTALRVGKRVRTETDLGKENVSVASIAVKLAEEKLKGLQDKSVFVIGAGDMALSAIQHLQNMGVSKMVLTNRSQVKAEQIAGEVNAEVIPFNKILNGLIGADVVVTGTSSPTPILDYRVLKEAMEFRSYRPLVLLDIAVPRDVYENAKNVRNIHLYAMDDLEVFARKATESRRRYIEKAQHIIDEEVSAFVDWSEARKNAHMITYLKNHFEKVREEVLGKYGENEDVRTATRLLMNKLLHTPFTKISEGKNNPEHMEQALDLLFDISCPRKNNK